MFYIRNQDIILGWLDTGNIVNIDTFTFVSCFLLAFAGVEALGPGAEAIKRFEGFRR